MSCLLSLILSHYQHFFLRHFPFVSSFSVFPLTHILFILLPYLIFYFIPLSRILTLDSPFISTFTFSAPFFTFFLFSLSFLSISFFVLLISLTLSFIRPFLFSHFIFSLIDGYSSHFIIFAISSHSHFSLFDLTLAFSLSSFYFYIFFLLLHFSDFHSFI